MSSDLDVSDSALLDADAEAEAETAAADPELEAIKARVAEMEEEAAKLKELQNEVSAKDLKGKLTRLFSINRTCRC